MRFLQRVPLHPLLLAAYPVLYLLAANLGQVVPAAAVRPLLVSVAAAGLLLALLAVVLRDLPKAALLVTLLLAAFFTYGHVLAFLKAHPLGALTLGRHRYLALPYALLTALAAWRVLRARGRFANLTGILNTTAFVLVALSLAQIGFAQARSAQAAASLKRSAALEGAPAKNASLPDVYIIVLDSYARADVLQDFFAYDNTAFLDDLRALGFRVADCSHSNYQTTEFSLASMLNFDYMPAFGADFGGGDGPDGYKLPALIKENQVRQRLEALGYRVTAFETGYAFTDWWGVDTFYAPSADSPISRAQIHPFESLLLKTSAASLLLDGELSLFGDRLNHVNFPYADHINNVELALNKLPTLPMQPSPKLVFAHLVVPHKPMVFAADGSIQADTNFYAVEGDPINLEYFRRGYVDQVQFINARMLPILRWIIQDSHTPPVIVLMGDHGYSWGDSTFANLLALYLPGAEADALDPQTSNVNVFRLIFDRYFGANFGLLPNEAYFTDLSAPGGFRLAEPCAYGCPLCQ